MSPRRLLTAFSALLIGGALAGGLAACTPIVTMQPAELAASPDCAAVTVRLPSSIGDGDEAIARRETDAQATGAWGQPTAVLLHCGLPTPPPTSELPCVTPPDGSVDWLVDDSDAPTYVFTSYGRDPAVSVAVDNTVIAGVTVLDALDTAVSQLPKVGACVGVDDAG